MDEKRTSNSDTEHFHENAEIVQILEHIHDIRERIDNKPFRCGIDKCEKKFTSKVDYENHFEHFHFCMCNKCGKRFLCEHLLTMHLLEEHDNLFRIVSKLQPMYQCYMSTCHKTFRTTIERNQHAIINHSIPPTSPVIQKALEEID